MFEALGGGQRAGLRGRSSRWRWPISLRCRSFSGLVIQGRDIYRYPRPLIQALHDDLTNRGRHVIYSGGEYDSHLLVPVLAARGAGADG